MNKNGTRIHVDTIDGKKLYRVDGGIEWLKTVERDGNEYQGYTWNPIAGCDHGCEWIMPDGKVASCYAKDVAENLAQKAYPQGFAHHYWHPHRLKEPLNQKRPSRIFLDSMSDIASRQVPLEQAQQVLEVCRQAHWHTFLLLTKNAPRLLKFDIPNNVHVGVSSPPDVMMGKTLNHYQKVRMLERQLRVLGELRDRGVPVRWVSFEPLSWDMATIVGKSEYAGTLNWAVIGAASRGKMKYQPKKTHLDYLLRVLQSQNVPIFYKGNLSKKLGNPWLEQYPVVEGNRE